jgi:5,10-methylene-tetrahydrofolate dehydrogenase/methenyl tetrahydrofolate cyclohydrolase
MILLDGKTLSQKILSDLKLKIENLKISLDILLVGDDLSSLKYVSLKQTRASEIGIG